MKSIKFILFFCFIGMLAACSGNQNSAATSGGGQPLPGPTTFPPPGQNSNNTATTLPTGNVQHYTCPNNCEGSGGSVGGQCPVCGTEYVHNAAFHAQQPAATTTTTTPAATITPPSDGTVPLPSPTSAANANGVFHYTCPSGCEGGGATAGPCASCGAELVHNTAFHQ